MINKQKLITGLSALILASGFIVHGAVADDAERGKVIAYSCLGCHGIDGYRNAYPSYRVPKLGGQKEAYLVAALQGYRDGTREHPTMNAQSASLSDEDIKATAGYLATLGTDTVAGGGSDGTSFAPAQTCVACHGQNGISVSPGWPTLAGQHEDYLEHSLKQYRDGGRKDQVMGPLAAGLDDATIAQLAAYFASLKGLETTAVE
ncbi:MAG: c-type cytochrome [Woeseiaceae bacterium]